MDDYYKILGITKGADEQTIKKAYRRLAKIYHPDLNPGADHHYFLKIQEAYDTLTDPSKKILYDARREPIFDPYSYYAKKRKEQEEAIAKAHAEEQLKLAEMRAELLKSAFYPFYKMVYHFSYFTFYLISGLILGICLYLMIRYHLFLFFILLPFISLGLFLMKYTYLKQKYYRNIFY